MVQHRHIALIRFSRIITRNVVIQIADSLNWAEWADTAG